MRPRSASDPRKPREPESDSGVGRGGCGYHSYDAAEDTVRGTWRPDIERRKRRRQRLALILPATAPSGEREPLIHTSHLMLRHVGEALISQLRPLNALWHCLGNCKFLSSPQCVRKWNQRAVQYPHLFRRVLKKNACFVW